MGSRNRAIVAVLLAAVVACGGPPPRIPTRIERVYEGLSDPLPRIDPSILRGRRVLIDPGHGGFFRGTVGRDSLEESSVNLGVSLYLWGLLREAGADVHLTRSIDRDFLTPEDSALATDLEARVVISDTLRPDVFLSIHHNAQPARDPVYNSVETYYKAGDPASLDLAFAVHRHLMRNLGIDGGEVRQGNYYVLRNNDVPSVLGESSYLTHPGVEEKLRLSEKQKLEAEAYFLGLLDYFGRGIPRVRALEPADSVLAAVPRLVYELEDDGGIGIDPDAASLAVGGEPVEARFEDHNRRLVYDMPWDSPNGDYEASLIVRNLLGNSSPVYTGRFTVDLPPALAAFDNVPGVKGGTARVRARILDTRGVPIREGTAVEVASGDVRTDAVVRDGRVDVRVTMPTASASLDVVLSCRGRTFETTLRAEERADTRVARVVFVADARDRSPVGSATVRRLGRVVAGPSSDGGYLIDAPADLSPNDRYVVESPGYIPFEGTGGIDADTVLLSPWFAGALIGARFVLDPEGGRARDVGMGPLGLSASYVNLRMANYLAGFLRAAGAEARLTRSSEEVRIPEDVARMTNGWRADRYLEIRHRGEPPDSALAVRTYYFPGSRVGAAMASTVATAMSRRLGYPARPPAPQVTYPLQQTGCPAIIIECPAISDVDEELLLDTARYVREQAYAAFLGILEHYSVPEVGVVRVVVPGAPDWMVTLGGAWTLLTDAEGAAAFEHVGTGTYTLSLVRGAESLERNVELRGARVDVTVER
jgi:N-acetylmuramoyl-L-alanine amidase